MTDRFEFHTRRLTIRPIRVGDFGRCQETRSRSVLSRAEFTGTTLAISPPDRAAFREMVEARRLLMELDESYHFGVFQKTAGAFVGEVMLFEISRGRNQSASVGEVIYSPYRQKGYARETLRAVVRYAFRRLRLHRIEGQADPANHASIALCTKAGFRIECVSPRRIMEEGRWKDMTILSVTREEL